MNEVASSTVDDGDAATGFASSTGPCRFLGRLLLALALERLDPPNPLGGDHRAAPRYGVLWQACLERPQRFVEGAVGGVEAALRLLQVNGGQLDALGTGAGTKVLAS